MLQHCCSTRPYGGAEGKKTTVLCKIYLIFWIYHLPGRCRAASRGWRARCRRSLPSRSSSGNKSKVILVQVVILDSLKTKKQWVAYLETYFGAIWGIPRKIRDPLWGIPRIIRDPLWGIPRIIRDSLWGIPRIIRDSLWGIPRIKQIKALDEP